jgi:CheY-like chemotaxis protein
VIHRNAQAQVKIIEDILDVSRIITGKLRIDPRPSDLVAIARDAIEVVRPSADAKRIRLEFEPDSHSCLLIADPERLQQVVWNLLSNAVKFTDAGGRVRVHVGLQRSQVVLVVTDTGKGIQPDFLPLVFERFRQADSSTTRRVGGLGLGLALVRHIVELHGGRVTAASDGVDQGATFTITLPLRPVIPATIGKRRAAASTSATAPGAAVVLDGIKVLIVDDEADARDLVAEVLAEVGAVVKTAPSAMEGFDTFQLFQPDVLVSDIGMPDEDGYSLMRRIRALPIGQGGRVGSLALTAFAREEDRIKAISAGYTTHLGKPASAEALASAVANLASVRQRA